MIKYSRHLALIFSLTHSHVHIHRSAPFILNPRLDPLFARMTQERGVEGKLEDQSINEGKLAHPIH